MLHKYHDLTFTQTQFPQVVYPLLKLWFLDAVQFRTFVQQLEHTGWIEAQGEQSCESWQNMFGSTSSSQFGHSVMELLCLGVCESHIKENAQGQLCVWLLGWRTEFMVEAGGGAQQSAPRAQGLEVASPKLRRTDNRGGISYRPPEKLWKRETWL